MKAKLTLSIAATLALLLFCVVVTVNSPRSLAGEALGIDLPRPIETQWSDDHGGFLGDGVTRGVLVFSSQNGAALEKALAENEVWHTLPLPEPVQLFVYGGAEYEKIFRKSQTATTISGTVCMTHFRQTSSSMPTPTTPPSPSTTPKTRHFISLNTTPDFFPTPLETGEFLYFFELFLVTSSPRWGY